MVDYASEKRMKVLTFLLALPLLGAASAPDDIRNMLDRQVADWNRGDVRAFMRGYDDSEETAFVSSAVVKGYQSVLRRYLDRYSTREKMGTLAFSGIDIRMLGADYACAIGQFHLSRSTEAGGDAQGIFTLVLHKTSAGWKIVLDHTNPQ